MNFFIQTKFTLNLSLSNKKQKKTHKKFKIWRKKLEKMFVTGLFINDGTVCMGNIKKLVYLDMFYGRALMWKIFPSMQEIYGN